MTLPECRDRIRPRIFRAGLICAAFALGQIGWLGAVGAADKHQAKSSGGSRPPSPQTPKGGGDRGIGGTGFIGTITKFGSIFVNGAEIFYGADATVMIDGRRRPSSALKIGQVARVQAVDASNGLRALRIASDHEVVGPVESVDAAQSTMSILGQTVEIDAIVGKEQLKPGDWVAVSGIRRPQGAIVASLLETIPQGQAQILGQIEASPQGGLHIGALPLIGTVPKSWVGKRAIVRGAPTGQALRIDQWRVSNAVGPPGPVRQISIEGYFQAGKRQIELAADPSLQLIGRPQDWSRALAGNQPTIVDGLVTRNGAIQVTQIRAVDSQYRDRHSEEKAPALSAPPIGVTAVPSTPRADSGSGGRASADDHAGQSQSAGGNQSGSASHEGNGSNAGSSNGDGGAARSGNDDRGESSAQSSASHATGGKSGDN